jgi:hypothetical protein
MMIGSLVIAIESLFVFGVGIIMDVRADLLPPGSHALGVSGNVVFYIHTGSIYYVDIDEFVSDPETVHIQLTELSDDFLASGIASSAISENQSQIQISNSEGWLAVVNFSDGNCLYIRSGTGVAGVTDGTRTEYRL